MLRDYNLFFQLVSALSKGLTAMSEAPSRMKTSFVSQDYDHGYAPNTGAGSGGNYNDYYDTPSSGNDMYMDNGSGYYDQSMYSSSHNMYWELSPIYDMA